MTIVKILLCFLTMAFGVFLVVFGGYDDSPGAQLLGLVVAGIGVFALIRRKKKSP